MLRVALTVILRQQWHSLERQAKKAEGLKDSESEAESAERDDDRPPIERQLSVLHKATSQNFWSLIRSDVQV